MGIRRTDPKNIDGVEVYNGKTDDRRNAQALAWAKENGKLMVSGSDFHTPEHLARGGIITKKPIQNNADLLTILKNSDFRLINVDLQAGIGIISKTLHTGYAAFFLKNV